MKLTKDELQALRETLEWYAPGKRTIIRSTDWAKLTARRARAAIRKLSGLPPRGVK